MPFKSSEIRWFSTESQLFAELFDNIPEVGHGEPEPVRTDYYLKSNLPDTGIKIREGNHEIKVKISPDESFDFGKVEHWMKWSASEQENILEAVDSKMLPNWIAIEKRRFKKIFTITNDNLVLTTGNEFLEEGCGIEFTKLRLSEFDKILFTFGLEAFSSENREYENLLLTINQLSIDWLKLKNEFSGGYPEWLNKLKINLIL